MWCVHYAAGAARVTTETAENCRELDLHFIDTAGNAYVRGAGLFVWKKVSELLKETAFNWQSKRGQVQA